MSAIFEEHKATEVATKILLSFGQDLHAATLLKLMYLIELKMMITHGLLVTYSSLGYASYGPVLLEVRDKLLATDASDYWHRHIGCEHARISVITEGEPGFLSPAEEACLLHVLSKYQDIPEVDILMLDDLPDDKCLLEEPIPLSYEMILRVLGSSASFIDYFNAMLDDRKYFVELMQRDL